MGKRRLVLTVVIALLIAVSAGLVAVWPARVTAEDDLQPGAGSNTYAISPIDSNGDGSYYNTCTMPSGVRNKMVIYAVGVDNATVKFSNIRAKLTGEVIKLTIEDYGLFPIVRGKTAETSDHHRRQRRCERTQDPQQFRFADPHL